jgi:hypothetical protein
MGGPSQITIDACDLKKIPSPSSGENPEKETEVDIKVVQAHDRAAIE